jgi:hypothetical protein
MTNYFKATFSNGVTKKRSSERSYTHAWLAGGECGFSSSERLAQKAVSGWQPSHDIHREVVSVEEITAKDYRS